MPTTYTFKYYKSRTRGEFSDAGLLGIFPLRIKNKFEETSICRGSIDTKKKDLSETAQAHWTAQRNPILSGSESPLFFSWRIQILVYAKKERKKSRKG